MPIAGFDRVSARRAHPVGNGPHLSKEHAVDCRGRPERPNLHSNLPAGSRFLSDADGKEIIVDTLGPSDYFGEMALRLGAPRSASVMTVETSKVSIVQGEDFRRYLNDRPDASYALILRLIGRARHLSRTVGNLALLDVYGRACKASAGRRARGGRSARSRAADASRGSQARQLLEGNGLWFSLRETICGLAAISRSTAIAS